MLPNYLTLTVFMSWISKSSFYCNFCFVVFPDRTQSSFPGSYGCLYKRSGNGALWVESTWVEGIIP